MPRYYFVATSLPPLSLGVVPDISFQEFREMLEMNLTVSDLKKFKKLLEPIDIYNIKALWLKCPLDERGNFSSRALEEAILIRDLLPSYVIEFLERYESIEERLRYFSSLYASLYRQNLSGFLFTYYSWKREMFLVLSALRAKKLGRDIIRDLQFEDPMDFFVAQIFAQKESADYTPPAEYEGLKALFMENASEPKKLGFALLQYQFKKIEEMGENCFFDVDQVLTYAAKLLIVEDWNRYDFEKTNNAVEELNKYG